MKATDYSRIAGVYDQAALRHRTAADEHLAAHLAATNGPFSVLDVACGTGNYLRLQRGHFPDPRISWSGIDASPDMLEQARPKLPGVDLTVARAESLPQGDATVDYLSVNFAFHHFEEKERALDEMIRVLKPDGWLRMSNVAPDRMPDWWVFRFFPESRWEDEKRFWSCELILHELERRGMTVDIEVRVQIARRPAGELVREAEKRDMSSVAVASERCFSLGMAELERLAAAGEGVVSGEAIMLARARRRA
jgi:ubiquinone/menaquinone biosynthesis C-methylase UbiE